MNTKQQVKNNTRNFYVAIDGNDDWSGRVSKPNTSGDDGPFRTINRAVSELRPGDILTIGGGVYREQVKIDTSGTHDAPIVIRAREGERVIISAFELVTDWIQEGPMVERNLITDWQEVTPTVYYVDNWEADTQVVLVDGMRPLVQIGESFFSRQNWIKQVGNGKEDLFSGSFYSDTANKRLYVYLPAGRNPDWHVIEASVRDFTIRAGEWIRLEGLTCVGGNSSRMTSGDSVSVGSNSVIDNCTVMWSDFCGLASGSENVTVSNSRFIWNGGVGMTIMGKGHLVENSEFMYNNWRGVEPGWHVGGMKNTVISDTIIRRNIVAYNDDGIWFDIDCKNIVIEENLVYNNGVGIHYEISYPTATIRNNIVIDNAIGIWSSNSSGVTIENNTIVGGREGIRMNGIERGKDYVLSDNVCRNNIICQQSDIFISLWPEGERAGCNISDGNLFFSYGDTGFVFGWHQMPMSLSQWRKRFGQELKSKVAEPSFKAPVRFDYRPDEKWSGYGASSLVLEWAMSVVPHR